MGETFQGLSALPVQENLPDPWPHLDQGNRNLRVGLRPRPWLGGQPLSCGLQGTLGEAVTCHWWYLPSKEGARITVTAAKGKRRMENTSSGKSPFLAPAERGNAVVPTKQGPDRSGPGPGSSLHSSPGELAAACLSCSTRHRTQQREHREGCREKKQHCRCVQEPPLSTRLHQTQLRIHLCQSRPTSQGLKGSRR